MTDRAQRRERTIGLFLAGSVLLDPPILWLFNGATIGGWPAPYVYFFVVWALLILGVALLTERRGAGDSDGGG